MPEPLKETDIIFPHLSGTPHFSTTLTSLRQATLSIHNRLSSIALDSAFVTSIAEAYGFPLVANERCGSWYIPPGLKYSSAYFKSTDGHMGEWSFSLRRLNMQLLDVVGKCGGAVVVDSTRRGKAMPDALSKTVPIWCCVINRAIFGPESGKGELFTPPGAVGESEHAQIEKRIDGFVQQFLEVCRPNILDLRLKLGKPLRPIWVTQKSSLPTSTPEFLDFYPLVLCTASRRVHGAEASENGYIQGAADDQEAWANGLTPELFWENKDVLMDTNKEELLDVIKSLLREQIVNDATPVLIRPTKTLHVSTSNEANFRPFSTIISCTTEPLPFNNIAKDDAKHYLHLKTRSGKLGSRDLRSQLPKLTKFITALTPQPSNDILVCCPTGKDLSVGTALAILCLFADGEGNIHTGKPESSGVINKTLIKQRLTWITTSNPALNPSRATLQSVNAVLLESQDPKIKLHVTEDNLASEHKHTMSDTRPAIHESEPEKQQDPEPSSSSNGNSSDIPSTIFRNLISNQPWTFTRNLRSALPTYPSGTVIGTATFTPCILPTSSPETLLYAEEGEFATDTGLRFTARRKYVYQLGDDFSGDVEMADDGKVKKCISVHFFDDEKMPRSTVTEDVGAEGEGIGGLFVEMGDIVESSGEYEAVNREQHLCAEDLYTARWKFSGGMSSVVQDDQPGAKAKEEDFWWEVRYDVKGPKKDYMSTTRYVRSKRI